MPLKPGKKTVGATVTDEVYERIKHLAEQRHWSVAQALGLFIELYWECWEMELGITPPKTTKPSKPAETDKTAQTPKRDK